MKLPTRNTQELALIWTLPTPPAGATHKSFPNDLASFREFGQATRNLEHEIHHRQRSNP